MGGRQRRCPTLSAQSSGERRQVTIVVADERKRRYTHPTMLDLAVMRGAVLALVLSACGFTGSGGGATTNDAKAGSIDSNVVDAVVNPNAPDAMPDGPPPPPPQRVTANLLALYEFNDAVGSTTIKDSAPDPMNLEIRPLPNGSSTINFNGTGVEVSRAVAFTPNLNANSTTKFTTCHEGVDPAIDAVTMEAWVVANAAASPGSQVVSLVKSNIYQGAPYPDSIDVGLMQDDNLWSGQLRTSASSNPIAFGKTLNTTALTQIVVVGSTGDSGTISIYVNGLLIPNAGAVSGIFSQWSSVGILLFGEVSSRTGTTYNIRRTWPGRIDRLAIYCRALTPAEIMTHFNIGAERSQL
jgi:hypothetical protein